MNTHKELDLIKSRMEKDVKLHKMCTERHLSDTMIQIIIDIKKANTIHGAEQRSLTTARISDILQESKTEDEFVQKLKAAYP